MQPEQTAAEGTHKTEPNPASPGGAQSDTVCCKAGVEGMLLSTATCDVVDENLACLRAGKLYEQLRFTTRSRLDHSNCRGFPANNPANAHNFADNTLPHQMH
jgi:hypothetical protein